MKYAEVESDGWIRATYDSPQPDKDTVEVPNEVESRDPSKHEKTWHYNGGNPELRETGNTPPPTTEERVEKLEQATGVSGQGKNGIAHRIDNLEQRIADLEDSVNG